jgi:LCP family protein required for cell wall assembly
VLLVVVGAGAFVYHRLDTKIRVIDPQGVSKHRPPPAVAGQNILLIGSDRRGGADSSLGGKGDSVGRSDTTLLVHIYEGGKHAVGVSIPRDALVDIPPCLLPDGSWSQPQHDVQFNHAYSVGNTPGGNPACTVNTVEAMTHMRVDHTVVVDFAGFAKMTEIVGGVPVCLPNAIYQNDLDPNRATQGKLIFKPGVQLVSGAKALAYVRLRHGLGDGSDIGRMRRQQAFLSAVIAKVRAEGLTPTKVLPLAEAAVENMTVDTGLDSPRKLMGFVLSLRGLRPENITFVTTPWRYDGERVALVHPDVDQLWAALRNDQPLRGQKKPADGPKVTVAQALSKVKVPVTVLNATGTNGLAARTADRLKRAGVTVAGVGNAPASTTTVVEYPDGQGTAARRLASAFPHATVSASGDPGLRLVLGDQHDMRGLQATAVPPTVKLPKSIAENSRSAAANPCENISYGSSG